MPIISQFNYLKVIFKLEAKGIETSVSKLSQILKVAQPSVTQQLRALSKKKLVIWQPRGAIRLTKQGQKFAVDLIRKHRVIESFLVKFLDFDPLEAHIEAEELEHLASPHFVDRLHKFCGYPEYDPHGDPIPTSKGSFPLKHAHRPLFRLKSGQRAEIVALSEDNHKTLKTVIKKNLAIGRMIQKEKGTNQFKIDNKTIRLSQDQIETVFLKDEVYGS